MCSCGTKDGETLIKQKLSVILTLSFVKDIITEGTVSDIWIVEPVSCSYTINILIFAMRQNGQRT